MGVTEEGDKPTSVFQCHFKFYNIFPRMQGCGNSLMINCSFQDQLELQFNILFYWRHDILPNVKLPKDT
jgi:hypothetical protein